MDKYIGELNKFVLSDLDKEDSNPFAAMIVKDGEVISLARNETLNDYDVTAHAEIVAIREACKKLKSKSLSGCDIYTTVEPCKMCYEAIKWAKINKIYYGCKEKDYFKVKNSKVEEEIEKVCLDREIILETLKKWNEKKN